MTNTSAIPSGNKPHVWSHTSISCFNTCPKQFYHRYIAKDVKFEESDASRRGNAVHTAMEVRLKHKTPLPENMPYEKFAVALDERPLLVEAELGIRKDGDWAMWWDTYVYGRGKPDVVIMPADGGDRAVILDWKTGKVREDPAELETFAVLINARFPLITQFTGYYVWLSTPCIGQKHNLNWKAKWTDLQTSATKINESGKQNSFPATPNALCKAWCSVLSCRHNGRRTK